MNYGFEIKEIDGQYAPFRNGKQCMTNLGRQISYKTRKAAENYVTKQIAVYDADRQISDDERAAIRERAEREEAARIAERNAAYDERLRREREAKEARRQRAITNDLLRGRGYRWSSVGFKDEEDADAFDINAPIGQEWQLFSPDGRAVSVKEAMLELAYAGVEFAKKWLAERGIAETVPAIEAQRQAEREAAEQAKAALTAEQAEIYQELKSELLSNGIDDERAERESVRLARPHLAHEDQTTIKDLATGIRLVLNSDLRYGVMVGGEWCGIDEVLEMPELARCQALLSKYRQQNEVRA